MFGAAGFLFGFLLSMNKNPISTTLLRGVYAFIIFFVIAFVVRIVLSQLIVSNDEQVSSGADASGDVGHQVDLVAADEDLHDLIKPKSMEEEDALKAEFTPLNPPKLVKVAEQEPEQLAKAIRHLTEE